MAHLKIYRFRNVSNGWLIVSLLALLILLCGAYLLRPSIRAHYLFKELGTLQLGHSTFEDAEQLATKIHAKPSGVCNRSECTWGVKIDNAGLPRWWRNSGEIFAIAFSVKDSIVVRKYIGFGTGTDASFTPSHVSLEEQEHWGRTNTREPVQAGWYTTDKFRYYWFTVRMTPKASAEDRRRYTAFNYSCFWKYQGCKDARELLPTADPFPPELINPQ
jgi:hypothetical protein